MRVDGTQATGEPPRVAAVSSQSVIDIRLPLCDREVPLHASDEAAAALSRLGRTEDLAVSPDGALIAIAGFDSNQLALVGISVADDGVHVTDVHTGHAAELERPHGLTFLDDTTLLVANRESALSIVRLDDCRTTARSATVLIDGSDDVPVRTPGSVAVHPLGGDLVEVFVCNNYAHDLTRHLLDGRRGWKVVDAERLVAEGLDIPDGVSISGSGEWIAVSNHNRNAVYVYRYDEQLRWDTPPAGVLRGVNYPHGVAFADGDRQVVAVDAGLPNMYSFEAPDGDWSGEHIPWQIDRVMDEETFHRGRYNPQEGGPKGLEIVANRFVAVTSEFRPLAFFDLHGRVTDGDPTGDGSVSTPAAPSRAPLLRVADRLHVVDGDLRRTVAELEAAVRERDVLSAEYAACRSEGDQHRQAHVTAEREIAQLRTELQLARGQHADAGVEIDRLLERIGALEAHIDAVYASRSWRMSSPLRAPSWLLQRVRSARRR